ncbi:MAG TPA: CDP-diacylglycerol--glycerol-3-phosphate 3-phosphatidyltransferase [Bryobacteraceae bacterium]|nr:CDP-diacylglycerol--glycerol-3-phosphate 3-phosphatidyltransferase [Bryobacteraceae bacterium]
MNLPNALTLLRIFFVPVLVAALVQKDFDLHLGSAIIPHHVIALAIFLAAALTDLLDGYLARRWKQITTVGTLLDPIADKLLVSAALISLVQVGALPGWIAILLIGREFAITGLRSIAAAEGYVIRASEFGKLKLVMQVIAISLCMVALGIAEWQSAAMLAMYVVLGLTILSAVLYFRKFWREIDRSVKSRRRRELIALETHARRIRTPEGREPVDPAQPSAASETPTRSHE